MSRAFRMAAIVEHEKGEAFFRPRAGAVNDTPGHSTPPINYISPYILTSSIKAEACEAAVPLLANEKSLERFLSGGFTVLQKNHPRLSRALNGQKLFNPETWMTIQGSFQALHGFVLFDFVLTKEGTSQGLPALFIHDHQRYFTPLVNYEFCRAGKASLTFLSMTFVVIDKRSVRL